MRAVVIDRVGGPETLRLGDLPVPEPGPGEVLVRVAYAGVNPADWKTREGWLEPFFEYAFPFVLGYDMAGTVAAVGPDVAGLAPGERVVAYSQQGAGAHGSYAEYALADAAQVVGLPDGVDLRTAAALPVAGVTAWEGLFVSGALEAGHRVLVHGGSGGVGSYAVQLARHAGATVAVTCSRPNADYVRGLGADRVIDYRDESVADAVRAWAPEGVDIVLDAVGQGSLLAAVELTRPGGRVAPIATLDFSEPAHDAAAAAERGVRIVPTITNHERSGEQLRGLVALLADGHLRAPEIHVVPLDQVQAAHERVQTGHVRGKIVLEVAGEVA